jgi:hypothetical protein
MLGKLLLTLAVILVALVYLQKRRIADLAAKSAGSQTKIDRQEPAPTSIQTAGAAPSRKTARSDYRIAAWMFLALMLGAAAAMYSLRWQDANKEVSVLLHRDGNASPVVYRVLKKQLSQRSFTTVDGILVTVSANERMEVIGL